MFRNPADILNYGGIKCYPVYWVRTRGRVVAGSKYYLNKNKNKYQTNYFGAAAQKTVESVKNTRSAAPNPPCCEILASKDSSNLAERKFR